MRQPIEKSLRQRALEYLSKREYSAVELAQKL
nr:RecName: Full=Regulatory protein RecX [Methylophilus methylotrophus]